MSSKHSQYNLNSRYKGTKGNSIHAGSYRSFSDTSRSEVGVAGECTWLPMVVPRQKGCEVLQSDPNYARALKDSLKLFELYEKKINKASKKICKIFTQRNMLLAYLDLYRLIDQAGSYTKKLSFPSFQDSTERAVPPKGRLLRADGSLFS